MRVVSILSSNPLQETESKWNCELMISYRSFFKSTMGSLDCADFTLADPLGNGLGILNLKFIMQF